MAPALPAMVSATELSKRLREGTTTLVAIDLEGTPESLFEIRLAICWRLKPMGSIRNYEGFTKSKEIDYFTVQLRVAARARRKQERL
jgi:hypothetical protein